MSFAKNTAVTGFTFAMINRSTGAALTGEASNISGYYTIDGGTQASLSGTIAEEGNGQYSLDLTAAEMNGDIVGLLFTHASGVPVQFTIKTSGGSTVSSGESTLSVDFLKLRSEVGWLWLGERDSANWTTDETEQIDCMIDSGLRQFYHPPPVLGDKYSHHWTFLRPVTTLSTVADTTTYTLPDNFGGMSGPLTYAAADNRWYSIDITGEHVIRQLQSRESTTITSYPLRAAIRPRTSDGSDGQRFEIILWPTPDTAYTLSYRYHAIQAKLTTSNPYPLGGQAHSETILESCLAITEQRLENQPAIHTQKFIQRLEASVSYDRIQYTPDHMGIDQDRSDGEYFSENSNRRFFGPLVDYNGVVGS